MPSVGSKALPWKPGKTNLKIMKMKIIQRKKPLASKEAEKNKAKDIEENEKFLSWALTLNTQLSDKQFTIVQHTPRRKSSDYSTGLLGTVWGTPLQAQGINPLGSQYQNWAPACCVGCEWFHVPKMGEAWLTDTWSLPKYVTTRRAAPSCSFKHRICNRTLWHKQMHTEDINTLETEDYKQNFYLLH